MRRYLRLLGIQLRASLLQTLQYRSDFGLDGLIAGFWTATALIPLLVVFRGREGFAGWTYGEALLVTGWFAVVEGILQGAINPSLTAVVEHIRKGTLDFVLLKPADAQFLVSTAKFEPWRAVNVAAGFGLFVYAFVKMGHWPTVWGVLSALLLLACAVAILYSIWIATVSLAFRVVKIDNLTYLFGALFDAARWPVNVFPPVIRFVFTFVLPLAVMTTFPALALLSRLNAWTLALSLLGAAAASFLARTLWKASISRYTSASS
ncbi:MAG: ABC transporter permease [Myxococcaceae bacterium]